VALSVSTDVRDEFASVCIGHTEDSTETDVPCSRLVIAAGAWSPQVFATLFPKSSLRLPVSSLAGHSLVVRTPPWPGSATDECHAIFSTAGSGFSPELFSRVGGDIYLAGLNSSSIPLPLLPTDARTSAVALERLKETARILLASGARETDLQVVREALCYRPVTTSGRPILTRILDKHLGVGVATRPGSEGGVFVATGHGPWGISLSLGTGKVMAEMIQGRPVSANVDSLCLS
jgi:glycine/D-amino acid oxidase-like deaminating enzyme